MSEELNRVDTAAVDTEGGLDPAAAAALLDRATDSAVRQFNVWPPLLLVVGAVLFPVAFGVVWSSVRAQHPYKGPGGGALLIFYAIITVWVIVVGIVLRRATVGVGGRSARQRKIEALGFAGMLITVYVFQGALLHEGVSHAVVYGVYPVTAPFIFVGSASAIVAAAREEWRTVRVAVPLIAVALGAAFAGPVAVWLVIGIGIALVLLGLAIAQVRGRRVRTVA